MKIKKRIFTFAITAVWLISGTGSLNANGEEAVNEISYDGIISYEKIDNNSDGIYDYIKISSCIKDAVSVNIPDTIEGLPVTYIGNNAFEECIELTDIKLPNNLTVIGDFGFYKCEKLKSIIIPEKVTDINYAAFKRCSALESVTFPEGIEDVGFEAFRFCTSLNNIHIPKSLTQIGNQAFSECSSLTNITVDENNRSFYTIDNVLYQKIYLDETINTIFAYPIGNKNKKFTIPDDVDWIWEGAFAGSPYLTNVTIPDRVTEIHSFAFYGCTKLNSIEIPNSVTDLRPNVFKDCTSLKNVKLPDSIKSVQYQSFMNCSELTRVDIPDGVTELKVEAFSTCTNLQYVTIPESVTLIEFGAFGFCDKLTILGKTGSYAETYAKENKINFIDPEVGVLGDADGNLRITIADARWIAVKRANREELSIEKYPNADFNQDGKVTIKDAADIAKYIANRKNTV